MMFRLVEYALSLWSALAIATGLALLVGYHQPEARRMRYLHLADCAAPCWIEIVPGQTPINDAYDRLIAAFGLPMNYPRPGANTAPNSSGIVNLMLMLPLPSHSQPESAIAIHVEFVDGVTRQIRIPRVPVGDNRRSPIPMPNIGEAVNFYGAPTCVDPRGPFNGWSLFYHRPDGVLEIAVLGSEFVPWTQPIYFMSFRAHGVDSTLDCNSSMQSYYPWAGLSRNRYPPRS